MTKKLEPHVLLSTDRAAIAERCRIARKKSGLTQGQFAEAVGVTTTRIVNLELGRDPPSLDILAAIRPVLGISPEWVIHGGGENPWQPPVEYVSSCRVSEYRLAEYFVRELSNAGHHISNIEACKLARLARGYRRSGNIPLDMTVRAAIRAIKAGALPSDEHYHG